MVVVAQEEVGKGTAGSYEGREKVGKGTAGSYEGRVASTALRVGRSLLGFLLCNSDHIHHH